MRSVTMVDMKTVDRMKNGLLRIAA